jgi:hypothetical protein
VTRASPDVRVRGVQISITGQWFRPQPKHSFADKRTYFCHV